jgi:hypothetical protein
MSQKLPRAGSPAPLKAFGRMAMLDRVYVIEQDGCGGDRIVEYADQAGRPFLFVFVDHDETANRWLMFRVGRAALDAFCNGAASMLELWKAAESEFDVVDLDAKHRVVNLVTVPFDGLLAPYIPPPIVRHDQTLAPSGWKAFREQAVIEARRRREANQVQAKLGPFGQAVLEALHAASVGLSVLDLEKLVDPWDANEIAFILRELHDRNLIHYVPPPEMPRPVWCWGKHPDAIARELHRRADEGA